MAAMIPENMRETPFGVDHYKRIMYHGLFVKDGVINPKGSWDMVAVNSVEDSHESRLAASIVSQFRAYKIYDRFGMSLKEFLTTPKWLGDIIMKDAKLQQRQEMEQLAKAEDAANKNEKDRLKKK